jgi:HlyD family secretion protein
MSMKKSLKWIMPSAAVGIVLVAGTAMILTCRAKTDSRFQFGEVTRGDLENTVSSTGTIEAVTTVEVGTQVSGIISKILADFNDNVRKGQILAVLDTIPLRTQVLDAEARVEQDRAQLEQAESDFRRNQPLFEKGMISEEEFLPFKVKLQTQRAVVKSSGAALVRARQNLNYAFIRSPINGTVIQRNVEYGQTVAASFNTPTIFIIAQDLSKMEIHALVDESDIGQIKDGQPVTFTVEAFPDKTFEGKVRQIRLQPTSVQNVVNYTVIVVAENPNNLLLPGMTTTLNFIVEQRRGVLLVPAAALKFQPTDDMMKEFRKRMQKRFGGAADSTRRRPPDFAAGGTGFPRAGGAAGSGRGPSGDFPGSFSMPSDRGRLWTLDDKGKLSMEFVRIGASDGKMTEIVRGRDLKEGMKVIIGLAQKNKAKTPTATDQRRGFGGPPRLF